LKKLAGWAYTRTCSIRPYCTAC